MENKVVFTKTRNLPMTILEAQSSLKKIKIKKTQINRNFIQPPQTEKKDKRKNFNFDFIHLDELLIQSSFTPRQCQIQVKIDSTPLQLNIIGSRRTPSQVLKLDRIKISGQFLTNMNRTSALRNQSVYSKNDLIPQYKSLPFSSFNRRVTEEIILDNFYSKTRIRSNSKTSEKSKKSEAVSQRNMFIDTQNNQDITSHSGIGIESPLVLGSQKSIISPISISKGLNTAQSIIEKFVIESPSQIKASQMKKSPTRNQQDFLKSLIVQRSSSSSQIPKREERASNEDGQFYLPPSQVIGRNKEKQT